jgi:hypothetical protein
VYFVIFGKQLFLVACRFPEFSSFWNIKMHLKMDKDKDMDRDMYRDMDKGMKRDTDREMNRDTDRTWTGT